MIRITTDEEQPFERLHEKRVLQAGAECVVLLKNDDILPLRNAQNIALYGNGARHTIKGGTGSGNVNVRRLPTIEEGLKRTGLTITTQAWLDAYDAVVEKAKKDWIQKSAGKRGRRGCIL